MISWIFVFNVIVALAIYKVTINGLITLLTWIVSKVENKE